MRYVNVTVLHPDPTAGVFVGPYMMVDPKYTVTDTVEPPTPPARRAKENEIVAVYPGVGTIDFVPVLPFP